VTRQLRRLDECRTTLRDIADQRGAGADDVQR
jgi:hypothetical protein